ncbi:MAG TPA: PQQ-binding-like beta-propeller repeat protein [Longimicrobiales bacterium]|nr:PQQ-binding-like beta-propeller repeat protein [Longimicrobiales bacterium]
MILATRRSRTTRALRAAVVVGCAALLGACAAAQRTVPVQPAAFLWPTVQGNQQRAGHADQVAPEEPEVEWRVSMGRGFRSEPLVFDQVVLVAGSNRFLAAVDVQPGERYWEERLDASVRGGIVARRDTLWTSTESLEGRAYAIGLLNGADHWDQELGPLGAAPLLHGAHLYVASEAGLVAALDAARGGRAWRTRIPAGTNVTPVHWGGQILVASKADTLYALEEASGAIARKAALPGTASAAPALAGDTLIVVTHEGDIVGVALDAFEVAWRGSLGAPILAAPVVAPDGTIYALSTAGEVWRVPPGSGRPERLVAVGGATRASLTLARDRLLVGRLDGTLLLLRLDGSTVWRLDLEDSIVAPVALADGAIYVPLQRGALARIR